MENGTKLPEKVLMQNQEGPFNQDPFIEEKIFELRNEFKITHAIELGTCYGYSAEWFCKTFDKVDTVEIHQPFLEVAIANRLCNYPNCKTHLGSSVDVLPEILSGISKEENILVFVDSHWNNNWPILDELQIIKNSGHKPVIVIHDFFTPEHSDTLGYDSFENVPLCFEYIEEHVKAIYDSNFVVEYNSPETASGALRGVAYITPIVESVDAQETKEVEAIEVVEEPKEVDFWAEKKVGDEIILKTGERLEILEMYKFEVVKGKTECMVRYKDNTGNSRYIKSSLINI